MLSVTVTPAYGRDYKSAKAAIADWKAGKDFIIADIFSGDCGRYISCRDVSEHTRVMIRYARQTKVTTTKGGK